MEENKEIKKENDCVNENNFQKKISQSYSDSTVQFNDHISRNGAGNNEKCILENKEITLQTPNKNPETKIESERKASPTNGSYLLDNTIDFETKEKMVQKQQLEVEELIKESNEAIDHIKKLNNKKEEIKTQKINSHIISNVLVAGKVSNEAIYFVTDSYHIIGLPSSIFKTKIKKGDIFNFTITRKINKEIEREKAILLIQENIQKYSNK